MKNKIKYIFFFLVFPLLLNCSFDKKTGIWSGAENEEKRAIELEQEQQATKKRERIKIYSTKQRFAEEIISDTVVNLTSPKKNISWTMPGLNPQNSSGHIYLSGVQNKTLSKGRGRNKFWKTRNLSTPLVIDGNIIYSTDNGTIYNLNPYGKVNWKKNIYSKAYKRVAKNLTFTIYDELIYVADNIGFLYALDLNDGSLVWAKNHGIPLRSKIKVFEDRIFLVNQDNRILCFDAKKGKLIWSIRAIKSFIKSQNYFSGLAISKENDVVVLNSSGDLIKAKGSNGMVYWNLNTLGSLYAHDTDFFKSSDVVIDSNDIIFSTNSSIFSFNLSNGRINWKKDIVTRNTPIIDGTNVFVVADNGYFINLDRRSGKIIWSTDVLKVLKKRKRNTEIAGHVLASGKFYVATLNGYLIICSATTGKVEGYRFTSSGISTPPIISNGELYILTEASRVFRYR